MSYLLVPVALTAVFIVYVLYLLIATKDRQKLKSVLYPGLFFLAAWAAIYYFLLK